MIGKFSNSVNVEQNNNGGNSGGGSGGNNSFPLPILEEDVFLQGNVGRSYNVMNILNNPRERDGMAIRETDTLRQKDFNTTLVSDLYLEEIFWTPLTASGNLDLVFIDDKKAHLYGRMFVVNEESTITIHNTTKEYRILKTSNEFTKLTIKQYDGKEKVYDNSPAGTLFLITPKSENSYCVITEIRPFSFYDFNVN